ncbi:PREDICTED: transcription termination factor MTERF2, chloroplastic-like [Camelina sativa]|uniref:Transcription termination factor MTERF2, chloroplastic-like n=1 Tax=Camelina sativa TaxID=90675 RepID=A0ABM1QET9_CAMSA|nr:PREDICTED: transcription termination factor MTERF2, chloroplastic-like [Camelina sativa]
MCSMILHGRRLVQLQKWPNFSVSVQKSTPLSNSFSSSASAASDVVSLQDGRKGKNFTVSYLVGSLGLTTKVAESISSKVSFEDKVNPDSVLSLLRSYGFTKSQISSIITVYPRLLILDAEKSVAPKLQSLQSRGASSSELTEIVSKVPKILGKRGHKAISVYYDFVKDVIEADKSSNYEKLCHSFPQGNKENKIRNISVLRELGVAQRFLFPLLISDSQPVCGKERFEESLKKVIEMGFDPETSKFVEALRVIYRMSDKTIEEKVNVYKRLGFGVADVWTIFKKWPSFLSYSEKKITNTFETLKGCGLLKHEVLSLLKKHPKCICSSEQKIVNSIETFLSLGFTKDEFVMMVKRYPQCIDYTPETVKKKTEFIVKKMNWPLEALVMIPQVYGYSLEKRTVPRCNVIKTLMSKGLMRYGSEAPPMSSVLTSTDQVFIKRYVMKHDKLVPELMGIFTGENGKKSEVLQ